MKADRARLFFALWPDDAGRTALTALASDVHAQCGGRAVTPENIHLTLFFVGPVERSRVAALEAAAAAIYTGPFELTFDRIGYWRHNRIAWVGAAHSPPAISVLEASLRAALAPEGIRAEDRTYVPHITLVRHAERRPVARAIPPCVWRAEDFALVESIPAGGGVRYEVRRRWRPGGGVVTR